MRKFEFGGVRDVRKNSESQRRSFAAVGQRRGSVLSHGSTWWSDVFYFSFEMSLPLGNRWLSPSFINKIEEKSKIIPDNEKYLFNYWPDQINNTIRPFKDRCLPFLEWCQLAYDQRCSGRFRSHVCHLARDPSRVQTAKLTVTPNISLVTPWPPHLPSARAMWNMISQQQKLLKAASGDKKLGK